ncbi:uncharacterized protein LOC130989991 isoform X2 [Salvia miltiorrhiza]|uniref:uncharacterized protein LOC130989991 isoform X2 n=1 Tax=Salvia miltiorrhiza TaxID=226208 RepID=UPI0025ABDFA0|nr:uncharacterized protein LOC130989991 isoform X2 [Salvia miltiorrhiza]
MTFQEMHPIFGRVVAESSAPPQQTSSRVPFLYYLHRSGDDGSVLRVVATDFQCNTFQTIRSRQQLEDLKDDIGIGGSWSEFVDYITSSLKSGDVKLVMDGVSELGGASQAKLISQKAKGMPRILFSLHKLVDGAANEAMANLSLELYNEFKDVQSSLAEEKGSKYHLQKVLATEQEKNVDLQKQLNMTLYSGKHKSQKINDRKDSGSTSVVISAESPDKETASDTNSRKRTTRVAPTYRRSKVRGAILNDTEDDA